MLTSGNNNDNEQDDDACEQTHAHLHVYRELVLHR